MKDSKDHSTMELPGFSAPETPEVNAKKIPARQKQRRTLKQEQLELLESLGPTDLSGLPAWVHDENTDLTGLPIWR